MKKKPTRRSDHWLWGLIGGIYLLNVLIAGVLINNAYPHLFDWQNFTFFSQPQPQAVASNLQTDEPTPRLHTPTPGPTLLSKPILPSSTPFQPAPITPTPTPSSTPTPTPTETPIPTATATPLPTTTPSGSEEAYIKGIWGQPQTLSLTCESRSAADLAGYYGIAVNELDFHNGLPVSDNPEKGFVGNPNGYLGQIPPAPYGVHAGPVAVRLREIGLKAKAHKGMNWEDLKSEISAGRPVMVWVIGNTWRYGTPVKYTSTDGDTTIVAAYEHTALVIGYNETTVTLLDGDLIYTRSLNTFLYSWSILGNMAITSAGS